MLFKYGVFKGAGGGFLNWKIDCDVLTDEDYDCIASIVIPKLEPFRTVIGVPMGGLPLGYAFLRHDFRGFEGDPPLYVDDVWTTGTSMKKIVSRPEQPWKGFVIFARGELPPNVQCLFKLGDFK